MIEQTHAQAERMGAPRALALCDHFGGALDFQTGRWDEAETRLRRSLATYKEIGSASGEALSLQRLGVLLTARGALDQAMAAFDEGLVVVERASMRSHLLTRLQASVARNRLAAGDIDGAQLWIDEGTLTAKRHGNCSTCNALLLPEAVRVAVARGESERAETLACELERTADEFNSRAWTAMARQARARLLAAQGETTAAAEAFEQARQAYLAIDAVYDAARCMKGKAQVLAEAGDGGRRALAVELGEQARRAFEQLGAAGLEG